MPYDFDLFVIGGGSGGVRCARMAASHGAKVAVAEEGPWGGTCVNVGCVPKKLMVMASEYSGAVQDSHGFGWNTLPGQHDWSALIEAKDAEISRLNGIYKRMMANCTTFEARARFIDPHTIEVAGQKVTAAHIVIAVGGRPIIPDFAGAEHVIVSDHVFHMQTLPQRITIAGSGFIAVEFAGIFAGLGRQVDLVYRADLPLRGFDEDLRTGLAEAMAAQGIRLHPGRTIRAVTAAKQVTLDNGATIESDLVFSALGRAPYTGDLGLDAAGVKTGGMGSIPVDETSATNQPHIYAIGDVTHRINLTPVAIAEGHALADRLFGPGPRHWHLNRVAAAVFSTPPIATVGLTEAEAAAMGPTDIYLEKFTPMRHTLSKRARKTTMKLVVDQATQKVVGVHMLGEDAPEIIQGLSIAINAGATKQDFDRTVGIHPTAAEEFVTMRTRARVSDATVRAAE
ncbi:MAG: glutathione-disulfide reductase [Acetobacteraceae bacterium]|nr:glutathione-disulfide reductase [Acetobacteraceae bacterium]